MLIVFVASELHRDIAYHFYALQIEDDLLKFTINNHLGDDWNDINTSGRKSQPMIHKYQNNYFKSLYIDCNTILLDNGCFVKKSTQMGAVVRTCISKYQTVCLWISEAGILKIFLVISILKNL